MMTDSKDLSKGELIGILEVIEGARSSVTPDDIKEVIIKARELVSADRAICGIAKVRDSEVREIVSVVNGNCPMEWLSSYLSGKLYFVDPVVKFHTRCSLTQFWSDIFRDSTDRQSRLAIDHAADFGLKYGLSSGIYVPESNNVSILAFAGDRDRYNSHHKKIMDIISLHINNALIKSTYEFQSPAAFPELDNKAFLR
ncbi:MAG TPA: autoinducer binding domain-containing protein [Thermodesulfobacteriota bacterium]|nr:autoinducer binding domain-containing protein [Thermodesulfobacteriota bacterium]